MEIAAQLPRRHAVCAAQLIPVGREQTAPLEERTAALFQQLPWAGHDRVDKDAPHILRLHIGIPCIPLGGK